MFAQEKGQAQLILICPANVFPHPISRESPEAVAGVVTSENAARIEPAVSETEPAIVLDLFQHRHLLILRHAVRHDCLVEDVISVGMWEQRKVFVRETANNLIRERACGYPNVRVDPDRAPVAGKDAMRVELEPLRRQTRDGRNAVLRRELSTSRNAKRRRR
jgi:hypothetical protein